MIMQLIFGALFWIAFALFTAFKLMVSWRKAGCPNKDLLFFDALFILFSLAAWPIFLAGYMLYHPAKAVVCWLQYRADEETKKTLKSGDV